MGSLKLLIIFSVLAATLAGAGYLTHRYNSAPRLSRVLALASFSGSASMADMDFSPGEIRSLTRGLKKIERTRVKVKMDTLKPGKGEGEGLIQFAMTLEKDGCSYEPRSRQVKRKHLVPALLLSLHEDVDEFDNITRSDAIKGRDIKRIVYTPSPKRSPVVSPRISDPFP